MTGHSEGQWTNNIIVMQYKIVAMAPELLISMVPEWLITMPPEFLIATIPEWIILLEDISL